MIDLREHLWVWLWTFGVVACRPATAPPPDASDAQTAGDAPLVGCAGACAKMRALGCVVQSDCPNVLQALTVASTVRNNATGLPLTCDDILKAQTAADIVKMGQGCGPSGDP